MSWDKLKEFKFKEKAPEQCNSSSISVSCIREHITGIPNPATAPYSFVPLNEEVVPAECIPGKDFAFDKYHEGRFTGYIDLTIETKTPLYIRDTLTRQEMAEKERIEKDSNKKYINPNFFSAADKIRIPGSSLRGMTRTLVEIMSYSQMQFIDGKKKYHFRSFADKSLDLRKQYTDRMLAGNDTTGHHQQVKAGYLTKIGKVGATYKIKPAKEITPRSNLQYARVKNAITNGVLGSRFSYKDVEFTCNTPKRDPNHTKPLFYAEVTAISNIGAGTLSNPQKGFLVHSGHMPNKRMHWVIAEVDSSVSPLEFADGVIENYKNDTNRNVGEGAELLKKCQQGSDIPCFYIEENNKIISFGHTGLFRLAYKKSVEEFLPPNHRNFTGTDIAEAIFGNNETFAGRVFFEDAFIDDDQNNVPSQESVPKILSTPKPTTFQHYLVQHKSITHQTHPEEGCLGLQNYNDDTWLRGNKLYWHKSGYRWEEEKLSFAQDKFNGFLQEENLSRNMFGNSIIERNNKVIVDLNNSNLSSDLKQAIVQAVGKYEKQHTRIKPIEANKTFTGRIRFENLSKVELGALLFALDLRDGYCHKLGMGKPLGLGSVKITPTLHLSNRSSRYTDLSLEWGTPIQPSSKEGEKIDDFKNAFKEYVLEELEETSIKDLWQLGRMQELKRMLAFNVGSSPNGRPSDDRTKYMELGEFKQRRVLPKPTEVK